jgi:rhodanese-related sulfurtransferase
MKKTKLFFITFFITLTASFYGYSSAANLSIVNPPDEFEILLNYLESNSFIMSDVALPIIDAEEVKNNLKNSKYHVIDIRSESWYEYGHIKGAKNLKPENLLSYFEGEITPADFDKIVVVCYSGQSASYFASLLRLAGYNNVYSMKWGMSSWREDFAKDSWLKNINNDYASKIEITENPKPVSSNHPVLNTGKSDAKDILKARLIELFKVPYKEFIIKPADVFENTNNYFVINFTEKENYDLGHIAGAINYLPGSSLTAETDLLTLPTDKKIVVYDTTGHKSAYIVAYLNVLGYNIGNLAYGANGFMNGNLKNQHLDAFSKKDINMYPVIE